MNLVRRNRRVRMTILLLATHVASMSVGFCIGWITARSAVAPWEDELVRNFFVPAFREQLRHGSLTQARQSLSHFEAQTAGNGSTGNFQVNVSLLEGFALLAKREEAEGNREESKEAVRRAAYYCRRVGFKKCSTADIAARFVK